MIRFNKKDYFFITLFILFAICASAVSNFYFDSWSWGASSAILGLLIFSLLLEERRRKQKRHQELLEALRNTYSQIEALLSVRPNWGSTVISLRREVGQLRLTSYESSFVSYEPENPNRS